VDRVTIRELRNDVSRIVRRARAGERLLVTVNGVPAAEIGPLSEGPGKPTLEELIASGAILPPRTRAKPQPARPLDLDGPLTTDEILRELRARG